MKSICVNRGYRKSGIEQVAEVEECSSHVIVWSEM